MKLLQRMSQIRSITEMKSGRKILSEDFFSRVDKRSRELKILGVRKKSRAILQYGNTIEFFVDLFAIWNCDACAVPIESSNPDEEVQRLAKLCGASLILKGLGDNIQLHPDDDVDFEGHLILYTSGSTGTPKGVVHDLNSLELRLQALEKSLDLSDFEKSACILPTSFGHGLIGNSLLPILSGSDFYIHPPFNPLNLRSILELLVTNKISFVSSVPSFWRMRRNFEEFQVPSLQRVQCASASFTEDLLSLIQATAPNAKIYNVYGTTETASWVSGNLLLNSDDCSCLGTGWGTDFQIQRADPNGIGEVWLRTEGLTRGYWGHTDITNEKIKDGWFNTGDLGKWIEGKGLYLHGRQDDVINKGGFKIYPDEVERVLCQHPKVKNACVFGYNFEITGELVAAAIVLSEEDAVDIPLLENWCRQQLPSFRVPSRWFLLPEIPLNSRNKVDRKKVEKLCLKMEADDDKK